MPFVYCGLSYVLFIVALPFLLLHRKLRQGGVSRLGFYPNAPHAPSAGPRVWVHGASAGDILALVPTVRELKRQRPDAVIIASAMTNSGFAIAQQHSDLFWYTTYAPYDLPGATRRAMQRLRPNVLVLEYAELWPNLIGAATRLGVATMLQNGRLAQGQLRRYRYLFQLTGNLLQRMTWLLMRDEHEAARARRLGAPPERIVVTGNTKFDSLREPPDQKRIQALRAALGPLAPRPVWVAGSTHEEDEDIVFDVFVQLRRSHPDLSLVVAPRYVERTKRLLDRARRRGLTARLRSVPAAGSAADVVVLDTIGELAAAYALATLVFVGGSFGPRGGQNILEPAACGKPVLFGPNMQNFSDAVQVLLGRGGIQVACARQLLRVMLDLLQQPEHCRALGARAQEQVTLVRGAASRNAGLIAASLPPA